MDGMGQGRYYKRSQPLVRLHNVLGKLEVCCYTNRNEVLETELTLPRAFALTYSQPTIQAWLNLKYHFSLLGTYAPVMPVSSFRTIFSFPFRLVSSRSVAGQSCLLSALSLTVIMI